MHTSYKYKVAEFGFSIADNGCDTWSKYLKWHFDPFATSDDVQLAVTISKGSRDMSSLTPYFADEPINNDDIALRVYHIDGGLTFELHMPNTEKPNCWLQLNADCTHAEILLDEGNPEVTEWKNVSALTSATQLAYIMATSQLSILMAHASSVVHDGKAYLFIAKSGTGKSTHSSMWLNHITGTELLNDDHPIVRLTDSNEAIAYGSPWSGKTHCYKALAYPIGAIVRIRRSPDNKITRLSPVQAYASVSTSFSGFKWHRQNIEVRHRLLERLITDTPCYVLDCRPDRESALVCLEGVGGGSLKTES